MQYYNYTINAHKVPAGRLTLCGPIMSVYIAWDITINTEPPMPNNTAGPITCMGSVLKNVIVHSQAQPHKVDTIPSNVDT